MVKEQDQQQQQQPQPNPFQAPPAFSPFNTDMINKFAKFMSASGLGQDELKQLVTKENVDLFRNALMGR